MRIKKISLLIATLALTAGLAGCMGGGAKLPEGDVKVVKQDVQGVIELLLQSADYGKDKSTVASMILPEGSQYNVNVTMENYKDGQLVDTKEITNYKTETIDKNSVIHMIMNTGKVGDEESNKSIYSIAEVDAEKTTDKKNPQYKNTKINGESIDFDSRTQVGQVGKALDEDVALLGLVKFKEGDSEKKDINLETYKDEVGNYSTAHIIKLKVTKL
ncbi:hypothetical protein JCM1393_20000 [Clostridium carnis]